MYEPRIGFMTGDSFLTEKFDEFFFLAIVPQGLLVAEHGLSLVAAHRLSLVAEHRLSYPQPVGA